tara:strand:+ start:1160 stop:1651 length:492 start_codon:yes stop_codon:yes gene_type:complete
MDETQKEIVKILQENSRLTNKEISDLLNITELQVEKKIRDLISSGIIRQFSLVLNENLIEGYPIKALVELSVRPEKDTGFDSIAKRIYGYSEVVSHYLVSGDYDFLLVVQGNDHKDIAHFVFDKLATINNVKSTTTHFIFKSYKENNVLMEEATVSTRLPILP